MDGKALFLTWAPPAAIWSRWAKPVLFTQLTAESSTGNLSDSATPIDFAAGLADVQGVTSEGKTAIIVNLPGAESVDAGLALTRHGYRPVPLYNCTDGPSAVVSVKPIIARLMAGADVLQSLALPDDAPPAFLLDSNRLQGVLPPSPGQFDNRWVVFPQDFPSAIFLRSQGIERVLLIQHNRAAADDDLSYVLLPWQRNGLAIQTMILNGATQIVPLAPIQARNSLDVSGWLWYRALLFLTIRSRRSNVGGFGAVIPRPSSGGG